MTPTKRYCSFNKHTVSYDTSTHTFDVLYENTPIIKNARIDGIYKDGKKVRDITDFSFIDYKNKFLSFEDFAFLHISLNETEKTDKAEKDLLSFYIQAGFDYVCIRMESDEYDYATVSGTICAPSANRDDVFAICLDRNAKDFRCAVGNAVSTDAHAVYNRTNDTAVVVGNPGQTKLTFDKETGDYPFRVTVPKAETSDSTRFYLKTNIIADEYHVNFSPRNRNSTFPTPPIGWMTWYAVKFDACEEKVLANAKWQAENLKDFGANTVWVDWEWFHNKFYSSDEATRTDGVCSLVPDPEKYPHGLKYVADEIKEMGLIPSLWVTFFNEPGKSEFIEKYPDIVLAEQPNWCGKYWYDLTNPHYLNEYLPKAVQLVHDWNYEAIKIDVVPSTLGNLETYHENLYDPTATTKEVYRNVIGKVRELVGKDVYMLSCSSVFTADGLWASDIFDATRIGEDIFTWKHYLENFKRLQFFYGIHNIQLYNDPDNVVLRDEHSTFEQAKSRTVLHSLLGLPMTFGDEFSLLSDEKINLIKRSIPVLDIHPTNLLKLDFDAECFPLNLAIAKPYENYQVTAVFNSKEESISKTFDLSEDFHLDDGTYLVYDFYRGEFLGKFQKGLTLDFVPCEARVLAFRPCLDVPQIISTSRHITQGAVEILDMCFCDNALTLKSSLVANDPYVVTVHVPQGYKFRSQTGFASVESLGNILKLSFVPDKTTEFDFSVTFDKI